MSTVQSNKAFKLITLIYAARDLVERETPAYKKLSEAVKLLTDENEDTPTTDEKEELPIIAEAPPGKQPKTEPAPPAPPRKVGRPAPVGNTVSSGKSDWFKGTSWGNESP